MDSECRICPPGIRIKPALSFNSIEWIPEVIKLLERVPIFPLSIPLNGFDVKFEVRTPNGEVYLSIPLNGFLLKYTGCGTQHTQILSIPLNGFGVDGA